jgi:hypothetical protein
VCFCNNFLMYADFFEGFAVPPLAVAAVTQHMLIPHALPLWLDAHCLAEDEARQLQRALGFHTKTFSLLYVAAISRGHSCFVAKNCLILSSLFVLGPPSIHSPLTSLTHCCRYHARESGAKLEREVRGSSCCSCLRLSFVMSFESLTIVCRLVFGLFAGANTTATPRCTSR